MKSHTKTLFGVLRLSMGWLFLWAFLDKTFGLGFATASEAAWINGGSPTTGFLSFGTNGPFAEYYQALAGQPWVDWLFMLGLLFIGVALMLGIAMKLAGFFGALMMLLMYTAGFIPPEHNPFMDDHLIYAFLLLLLTNENAGDRLGLGKKWRKHHLVKKFPILE